MKINDLGLAETNLPPRPFNPLYLNPRKLISSRIGAMAIAIIIRPIVAGVVLGLGNIGTTSWGAR
jgi:hypothetical protein